VACPRRIILHGRSRDYFCMEHFHIRGGWIFVHGLPGESMFVLWIARRINIFWKSWFARRINISFLIARRINFIFVFIFNKYMPNMAVRMTGYPTGQSWEGYPRRIIFVHCTDGVCSVVHQVIDFVLCADQSSIIVLIFHRAIFVHRFMACRSRTHRE